MIIYLHLIVLCLLKKSGSVKCHIFFNLESLKQFYCNNSEKEICFQKLRVKDLYQYNDFQ